MSIITPEKAVFPKLERPNLSSQRASTPIKTLERVDKAGPTGAGQGLGGASESDGAASFGDRVKELMVDANDTLQKGQKASEDFAAGRTDDIHGTMVAVGKADISLRLVGSLRNKAIEAYREIMRMGA